MYASKTTCSRCALCMSRSILLSPHRHGAHGAVAWLSSTAIDAASHSTARSSREPGQDDTTHAYRDSSSRRTLAPVFPADKRQAQRRPSHQSSAIALFNDIVQRSENTHEATNEARTAGNPSSMAAAALGEWEGKMREIMQRSMQPEEKLRLFQEDIWPHIKEVRGQIPKPLYKSSTMFLFQMCDAVAEQGIARMSLALSKMLATIGKWDTDIRNQLILNLCHILIHRKNTSSERNALLKELIDMWQHLSQLKRRSQTNRHELRFVLPSVEEVMADISKGIGERDQSSPEQKVSNMALPTRALASIFIQLRIEQARDLVPGLLATMAVLSDPRFARLGAQFRMAPLLNLVSVALEHQPADVPYVRSVFARKIRFPPSKLSEVESFVISQWPQAADLITNKDSTWRHSQSLPDRPSDRTSSTVSGHSIYHKQLRTAYRSRNTGVIMSLWGKMRARMERHPDMAQQLHEDPEFLDLWVFVWCAIRRPDKLQEALEVMRQVQLQPTIRTYTSMMHGWKVCKDVDRIEALWHKLVESGLELDLVIWTERISGLIETGKAQAGIEALAEMQAKWREALSREGSSERAASVAVQPTVEVVNAAFKGLLKLDRQAAHDVLAWAGREGIQPNIRTFNILLRETLRSANPGDDAQSLLQAMKDQGIDPDAATFTILLEALLGGMKMAPAAEQVQAVQQVFSDMEAVGLQPTHETYGKMLHAVSSLANGGTDEAVAAVQAHMRAGGLSTTPHAVTILIQRALSRDPLPANAGAEIRNILEEHGLTSVNRGDQTLWERVVSAYAVTGELASAMSVFNQLSKAGRPVMSLPCLTDLLRALLAGGDADVDADIDASPTTPAVAAADHAREVVRVVLRHKLKRAALEAESSKDDDRFWKHHFWHLAREYDLVDWSEVPADLASRLTPQ